MNCELKTILRVFLFYCCFSVVVYSQNAQNCNKFQERYRNLESQALKKVLPNYGNALGIRVSDKVIVKIEVNALGKVIAATAVCGHPMLRAATTAAARKFEFPMRRSKRRLVGILSFNFPPTNSSQ